MGAKHTGWSLRSCVWNCSLRHVEACKVSNRTEMDRIRIKENHDKQNQCSNFPKESRSQGDFFLNPLHVTFQVPHTNPIPFLSFSLISSLQAAVLLLHLRHLLLVQPIAVAQLKGDPRIQLLDLGRRGSLTRSGSLGSWSSLGPPKTSACLGVIGRFQTPLKNLESFLEKREVTGSPLSLFRLHIFKNGTSSVRPACSLVTDIFSGH